VALANFLQALPDVRVRGEIDLLKASTVGQLFGGTKIEPDHIVGGGKLGHERFTNEAAAAGYDNRVVVFRHGPGNRTFEGTNSNLRA
jgi:hypothetical protein